MPRLLHGLLLLVLVATASLAPAQKGEDSPVVLFKKYYGQYKDTASRVEAVLTLESTAAQAIEDPAVFEMLYAKLGDKTTEPDVVKAIVRVFVSFKTDAQQAQVFDTLKTEKSESGKVALLQVIARVAPEGKS